MLQENPHGKRVWRGKQNLLSGDTNTPELSSPSCRKRELTEVSSKNKAEAIREYPCDDSEHHQKRYVKRKRFTLIRIPNTKYRHAKVHTVLPWEILEGP